MSMDAIAEIKARRAAFLDCVETLRKSTAKRDSDEYNREWTAYWKSEATFKNAVLVNIDSLLAEVERLRAERSEWCDRADALMTEQMTQMRDLLAENARLNANLAEWQECGDKIMLCVRGKAGPLSDSDTIGEIVHLRALVEELHEALTVTPEKVEAAAEAQYEFDNPGGPEFKDCVFRCLYLDASRAALLAAGMQGAEQ